MFLRLCLAVSFLLGAGFEVQTVTAQTLTGKSRASSTVAISSTPSGAEIFLDQNFVGNTPSSVSVAAGKHWISVRMQGFEEWRREVTFSGGSVNVVAELAESKARKVESSGESATPTGGPADSLKENGRNADPAPTWRFGVSTKSGNSGGFVITALIPKGPAEVAGLRVGDEILKLNEKALVKGDFESQLSQFATGSKVAVTYMRGQWQSLVMVEMAPERHARDIAPEEDSPTKKDPGVDPSLAEDIKYGGLNHILVLQPKRCAGQVVSGKKTKKSKADKFEEQKQRVMCEFPQLSEEQAGIIVNHGIFIGMTVPMLQASWRGFLGPVQPETVNSTYTESGTHQQAVYRTLTQTIYVYFDNGIVTSYQTAGR